MKILWRKFGFTTNSSGSYEWLPGQATTSTSSISISSSTISASTSNSQAYNYSTSSTTSLPITTSVTNISLAGRTDSLILLAAVLTGIISVVLLVKDVVKSSKCKRNVNH
jgi:hypothetical protein